MATTTTTIYQQQQATITMNNINFAKRTDLNSLVKALQDEDYSVVNQLLTKRTLGRERSRVGRTALHYIAENGNTDCLELLTSLGDFDLNAVDHEGHTGLHLAVINGNRDSVQILVNAKANINCLDNEKHSLVHWATVCGESEILSLLLLNGANASTMDIHNATPLHYAAQMCGKTTNNKANGQEKFNVPRSRSLIILRQLIQHNVNVSVKDRDGREPLLWAASAGSSEAILALVNAGASVDAEDKDGLTALHCAASRGHTDCIETLIGLCGCNVDIIDNNGCTALFYAVTLGHPDCTELLLNYGSEPNRQDRKGRTPAHCASSKGQLETIKQIHKHGANLWMRNVRGELPLHEAILSRRKELVLWLLSQRPEAVNAMNNDGRCCLHLASLSNNVQMTKILLDHSADVNPVMRNGKGTCMTPLDAALHRGNSAVAKFLQLHGGVAFNSLNDPKFMSRMLLNRSSDSRLSNNMMTSSRLTYNNMTNIQCSTPDNHVVLTPDYIISSTPIQHYYNEGQELSEEKKLLRMMEETQGRINISEESEGFENNSKTHNSFEMINRGGGGVGGENMAYNNTDPSNNNNNVNRMAQQQHQTMMVQQDIVKMESQILLNEQQQQQQQQNGLIKTSSEESSTYKGTSSESTERRLTGTNEIITRDGGRKGQGRTSVEMDEGIRGSEDLSNETERMSTGQKNKKRGGKGTSEEEMSQDGKGVTAEEEETEETEEMSHDENPRHPRRQSQKQQNERVEEEDGEEEEDDEGASHNNSGETTKIDDVDYELLGNVPVKKRRYNKNVKSAHQTNASNSNVRKKKFRKTKSIESKSSGTGGEEEYVRKERTRVSSARSLSPVKKKSILAKNGARSVSPSNIRGDGDGSVASSRSVSLDVGGQSDEDEDDEELHADIGRGGKTGSRKSVEGGKKSRSTSLKSNKSGKDSQGKSRSNSKKSNKYDDDKSRSHSRESHGGGGGGGVKSRSSSRKSYHGEDEEVTHSRSHSRKSNNADQNKSRSNSRKSSHHHITHDESEEKSKSSDKEEKDVKKTKSKQSKSAKSYHGDEGRSKFRKTDPSRPHSSSFSASNNDDGGEGGSRSNSSSLKKFLGHSRPPSSDSNENRHADDDDHFRSHSPASTRLMRITDASNENDADSHHHKDEQSGSSVSQSEAEPVVEEIVKTSKKKTSSRSSIPKPDGSHRKLPKPTDHNNEGKDSSNGEEQTMTTPKSKLKSQSKQKTKVKRMTDSSTTKDSGKASSKHSASENSENTDNALTAPPPTSKGKKVRQKKATKGSSNTESSNNSNNNDSHSNSSLTDEIDYGNSISLTEAVRNRKLKQRSPQNVKLPSSLKQRKNSEFPVDGRIAKARTSGVGSKTKSRDKGITSSEEREIEIQNKIISGKKQSVLYEMNKVDKLDKQIYSRSTSRMNESGLSYGRVAKSTDVETTVSVTQAMQVSMRKYTLERHIFSQLLELKRLDIENRGNKTAESMIVKRLVEANRRAGLNYHVRDFDAGLTFRNYEKYLYDQLKLLQAGNKKLLPRFAPSDDIEKLTLALRSFNNKQTTFPYIHEDDKTQQCIHATHKCHHAAHAYTGIPCAAYIPKPPKQQGPKKRSLLPRVNAAKAPGPIQKGSSPVESNSSAPGQLDDNRDIPHAPSPITLQLQQGDQKSIFQLPNDTTIDPSKNYYVSLSIKPSISARGAEAAQQQQQQNLNLSI